MGLLAIISLAVALFQLVPVVIKTILEIEGLVQGDKMGDVRKQLLMNTLDVAGAPPTLTDKVSQLVDKSVTTLNSKNLLAAPKAEEAK